MAEFTPMMSSANWVCQVLLRPWQVYVDGASNAQGAEIGIVLVSPESVRLERSLRLGFRLSNNKAEYEALIVGLKVAKKLDAEMIEIFSNSHLVVSQLEGSFEARDPRMAKYLKMVGALLTGFQKAKVPQISSGKNSHVDSVEVLEQPSKKCQLNVSVLSMLGPIWMDPIVAFITSGVLPNAAKVAEKIQRISARFWLCGDKRLYRQSFGGLYLLCLHPEKVDGLLTELHEGIYGSHIGGSRWHIEQ